MKDEEVIDLVRGAINHIESNTPEEAKEKARVKLAMWLKDKFSISLKGVKVSINDGKAYMFVDCLDKKENIVKEVVVPVDEWQEIFFKELKAKAEAKNV